MEEFPLSNDLKSKEAKIYCTKCGLENKKDAKFCEECGNEFHFYVAGYCMNCETYLNETAKMCTQCGGKLKQPYPCGWCNFINVAPEPSSYLQFCMACGGNFNEYKQNTHRLNIIEAENKRKQEERDRERNFTYSEFYVLLFVGDEKTVRRRFKEYFKIPEYKFSDIIPYLEEIDFFSMIKSELRYFLRDFPWKESLLMWSIYRNHDFEVIKYLVDNYHLDITNQACKNYCWVDKVNFDFIDYITPLQLKIMQDDTVSRDKEKIIKFLSKHSNKSNKQKYRVQKYSDGSECIITDRKIEIKDFEQGYKQVYKLCKMLGYKKADTIKENEDLLKYFNDKLPMIVQFVEYADKIGKNWQVFEKLNLYHKAGILKKIFLILTTSMWKTDILWFLYRNNLETLEGIKSVIIDLNQIVDRINYVAIEEHAFVFDFIERERAAYSRILELEKKMLEDSIFRKLDLPQGGKLETQAQNASANRKYIKKRAGVESIKEKLRKKDEEEFRRMTEAEERERKNMAKRWRSWFF